jgi:Acetyltransferase (GNAT) family
MNSLFSFYLEEREGIKTIEEESGFITYQIINDAIWIKHLYIAPSMRRLQYGSDMANQIAFIGRENKCKVMRCTVSPIALNASDSLAAILAYGFKVKASDTQFIYFEKDL